VADQGLADDPHALAGLRRTDPREGLRQQEVVDPRPLGSAVGPRPRHAQPAALGEGAHEGALRGRVHGLGELLGVGVHHVGRVVLFEKPLDLRLEAALLLREFEIQAA
jgi:hypothetical protein